MLVMLIDSTWVRFAFDLLNKIAYLLLSSLMKQKDFQTRFASTLCRQLSYNSHRICFLALQFTTEEMQAVNEMERIALDKVTPFPF